MMIILITIVHILVSLFLILVVLAQQGKGQDLASAFGGTGSQTAFGARGTATILSKITAGAAVLFMVTSLSLSYLRPAVTGETVIPDTPAPASTTPAPGDTGSDVPPADAESEGEGEGESEPPAGEAEPPAEGESGSEPPPQ